MEEPAWKKIKLSLERPYKDDNGNRIPVLLDLMPDGQHIYEPQENSAKALGENLRRVFVERGVDFFERSQGRLTEDGLSSMEGPQHTEDEPADATDTLVNDEKATTRSIMTTEDLFKMRMDILPQLYVALGEMSHAKELLTSLLLSPPVPAMEESSSSSALSATLVTKPPAIVSVQAFNAQLAIGGKDEALRKAVDVFKSAAESMERGRVRDEKYWVDALKIRRGNWGLIPAPLPYGSAFGKGADKTSKDFLVTYGLEESPALFRRRAVGHMASGDIASLVFPHRQYTRLRVTITTVDDVGTQRACNSIQSTDETTLGGALKASQQEVVEHEIFSLLVKEAGNLPTASARVSERLIVIDAAQGMELKFELMNAESLSSNHTSGSSQESCDLIFFGLHALLLRRHNHLKSRRLGTAGTYTAPGSSDPSRAPLLLRPIIDLLQYQVFCERIKTELDKIVRALDSAGIPSGLRFDPVGETGEELIKFFDDTTNKVIGGEAVLRIDNRHTVRLTFLSPSSLTAHLSQATLAISSIPQLCQLLTDEIERCILQRICELGTKLCDPVGGTWFVDLNRCVGRWEGCVLNFRISYGKDFAIDCSAFQLDRTIKNGLLETYSSHAIDTLPLMSWVEQTIKRSIGQ